MQQRLFLGIILLLGLGLGLTLRAFAAPPPTCTVTTPVDHGAGSLRACVQTAQVGTTIDFDPAVFSPISPVTITVAMTLPVIITDQVTIDGSNAWVVLDGSRLTDPETSHGLVVDGATGVILRGLQLVNFSRTGITLRKGTSHTVIGGDRALGKGPLGQGNRISRNAFNGIVMADDATQHNRVEGNYIGVDLTGTKDQGNDVGILLGWCTHDNFIGGATPTTRNLISGNDGAGVQIQMACTTGNRIAGNDIGIDRSGVHALKNTDGVIMLDAAANQVGGEQSGEHNVISGNEHTGIWLQGTDAINNHIIGNFIGTDGRGRLALGNRFGIGVTLGARYNTIGSAVSSERNLISGNRASGILLSYRATANSVLGNYIGTDITGQQALGNLETGILIDTGAYANTIGGGGAGEGNLISGNQRGIQFQGADVIGNRVQGNLIGTDASSTVTIGDNFAPSQSGERESVGVNILRGAHHNTIGGDTSGEGNLISGHTRAGINIEAGCDYNQVLGNWIGLDRSGQRALGSQGGINVWASYTIIGGITPDARNVISGNRFVGINLSGTSSAYNRVIGNYIGTNIHGTQAISNAIGVYISDGAHHNWIGGAASGAGNLISGNKERGIEINNGVHDLTIPTHHNMIQGNRIGTDATGAAPLGNETGIILGFSAQDNLIGGPAAGERNLISGNQLAGIWLLGGNEEFDSFTTGNRILGNYIGVDHTGNGALGNQSYGIGLGDQARNNVIGGLSPGEGNIISANGLSSSHGPIAKPDGAGIGITGADSNLIQGNHIGVGADGVTAVGNANGILVGSGARWNQIGIGNTIAYNAEAGIMVVGNLTQKNIVSQNAIYQNDGGQIIITPPQTLSPTLIAYEPISHTVTGQACRRCQVEIFANPSDLPGGVHYLGTTTADRQGHFILSLSSPPSYPYLTATATERGSTSPFSDVLAILTQPTMR